MLHLDNFFLLNKSDFERFIIFPFSDGVKLIWEENVKNMMKRSWH